MSPAKRPSGKIASRKDASGTIELKVVAVGNSRGVRLPKAILDRYQIKDALVLEARDEGLLIRGRYDPRMTWEETFKDMAREKVCEKENWQDLETTLADGLDPAEKW